MTKRLMALMALMTLTACDYAERRELRAERDDSQYREAMDDYRAGRLDAAVAGFEKTVARDPANASARFQLACLYQDAKKRYLDAYCGYREYLLQHPGSDKAKLAKDRMDLCEKEIALSLANKHKLLGSDGALREVELVRGELKAVRDRLSAAEKDLAESQARVQALADERGRLLAIVKEDADAGASVTVKPSVKEARELLEEDDGVADGSVPDDVAKIKAESDDDLVAGALPISKLAGGGSRMVERQAKTPSADKEKPKLPERPQNYTIREGDTLYGIAKRFYGELSAWKRIRDANKALISTDGRVRVGDVIRLP